MVDLAHTPYDGSAKPFTIGLKPLDPDDWFEVDAALPIYLAEKREHFECRPDAVFVARHDTLAAQREVLDQISSFLPRRFPEIYRRAGDAMSIAGVENSLPLEPDDPRPLKTASLLVQEDLVLMRKCDDGWRLVAASLCFPSSWTLAEKFDRPLQDIHIPVPAFGPGTRTATLIDRIFDNMKPDLPVERLNWSIQEDARLHHPRSKSDRDAQISKRAGKMLGPDPVASAFIRVERQTLRKLPLSGDILFTIRIYLDPMAKLKTHPDRATLAAGLADQLAALDGDQLAYKGLATERDRLANALRALAHDAA